MMQRLLVYSHDTYGLGNIRRMLAICEHLLTSMPHLTILLVSSSPMIQSFRLPQRLDYIKLLCLSRTEREGYTVKSVGISLGATVGLRTDLVRSAVAHFQPDVVMVDKKPYGVEDELLPALSFHQPSQRRSKRVLVLRDILDAPEDTCAVWQKRGYHEAIAALYDLVLVVGSPAVFDLAKEYRFPAHVADKVRYCGYIRREADSVQSAPAPRPAQRILVTSGGGQDGYHLLSTYLRGLRCLPQAAQMSSLVVCGPEMPLAQRSQLSHLAAGYPHVQMCEFTDQMLQKMAAAEVVVAMAGYNTVCEILSLQKRAVLVPRVHPVQEQWIRASRMAQLGLFQVLHPAQLTPDRLIQAVMEECRSDRPSLASWSPVDLDALPRITQCLTPLFAEASHRRSPVPPPDVAPEPPCRLGKITAA